MSPFGLKLGPMSSEVTSVSVPQGVAGYIKGLIRRGELSPGDRLPPERQLAESLGVARVSLREAFKQLQEEGYIVARRGKSGGNFVTALSQPLAEWRRGMLERAEELDDLTTMRVAVECHAATLAASRRTQKDLDAMLAAIRQQASAANRTEFRLADALFHDAVAKAAGSRRLEEAIRRARGEFFSPADMLDHPDPVEEDQRQHQRVFEAIRDGDPARAHEAMQDHIENTRHEIRRILEQES
jgi:GntR family transcriptional repressor for pyruvate dehydrogenase complex